MLKMCGVYTGVLKRRAIGDRKYRCNRSRNTGRRCNRGRSTALASILQTSLSGLLGLKIREHQPLLDTLDGIE